MAGDVDRTGAAVRAQLAGMGCALYEVGLLDRARDAMLDRVWDAARVEASIAWLKRQNAGGDDIYIRPRGSVGLLFVDDLAAAAVARLRAEGLAPAVLVESSPGNFQAWVRVAVAPIAPILASAAARELAVRYGGDPQSAAWRHYGRLAGFTNRKPSRRQPKGLPPYALLRHAGGGLAARAADLLRVAEERVKEAEERAAARAFLRPPGPRRDRAGAGVSLPHGAPGDAVSRGQSLAPGLGRVQGACPRTSQRGPRCTGAGVGRGDPGDQP